MTKALAGVVRGPLAYHANHTIPFGVEWNAYSEEAPTAGTYMNRTYTPLFSGLIEFPYAQAGGVPVTPARARKFGADYMRGVVSFFSEHA